MAYLCPFCGVKSPSSTFITKEYFASYNNFGDKLLEDEHTLWDDIVSLEISKCPECRKTSVKCAAVNRSFCFSYPPRKRIDVPDYVPEAIRKDYFEALSIIDASPKAAATLARRCLQGMVRDFWNVKEKSLYAEITSIKDKFSPSQWKAIDATRKIGNIGAHMEKDINLIIDIEPEEASRLIDLIELLIQNWYISRHMEQELYSDIQETADKKEAQRSQPT